MGVGLSIRQATASHKSKVETGRGEGGGAGGADSPGTLASGPRLNEDFGLTG